MLLRNLICEAMISSFVFNSSVNAYIVSSGAEWPRGLLGTVSFVGFGPKAKKLPIKIFPFSPQLLLGKNQWKSCCIIGLCRNCGIFCETVVTL